MGVCVKRDWGGKLSAFSGLTAIQQYRATYSSTAVQGYLQAIAMGLVTWQLPLYSDCLKTDAE